MNVYFINCLLACMLSYIVGYMVSKRNMENRFAAMLQRMVESGVIHKPSVTSDVKIH